ncbi:MAG: tRNA lysidine(34) synthetase TilS [Pseudomonadota bacterium]
MLEHKLKDLKGHGRLALAVSGGRDSTALLLLAARILDIGKLHVLTVDHKLRPEAAGEAALVKNLAGRFGLAHTTLEWLGEKPETGIQAAARDVRYALMTGWCREHGYSSLVTAHTLDDQAETVLMRLKRGSGVDGLAAMAPESWRAGVCLLRPLLDVTRSQLTEFLERNGQGWIDDPSNEDQEFERIRLRKNWTLVEDIGLTREHLARAAMKLGRARAALEHAAASLLEASCTVSDLGIASIRRKSFQAAPEELRLRALSRCLQAIGGADRPAKEDSLERALHWLGSAGSGAITLAGCRLATQAGETVIARELGRISQTAIAVADDREVFWDNRFRISASGITSVLTAAPVGKDGWASLKAVRPAIPAFAGRSLPALWHDDHIIAVPSFNYVSPDAPQNSRFSAVFANRDLLRRPPQGHSVTGSS